MTAHPALQTRHRDLAALVRGELVDIQPRKLAGDWSDTASFIEDLGLDSLDLVELVARLEQATGLFIPDEDLPRLSSVQATAEYVSDRQAADA